MNDIVAIVRDGPAPEAMLIGLGTRGEKGDPGGNIMAIGLFTDASGLSIPVGTDLVRTSGHTVVGKGIADYFADPAVDAAYVSANPRSSFLDTNGRGFRLAVEQHVNAAAFGAVGDGVADDSAAILAALAFAKSLRVQGVGYTEGSLPLYIPSGIYNCGSTTISWDFSLVIYGDFSSAASGGGTALKWTSNVTGLMPTASGFTIRNIQLQGAFATIESEAHGIHLKAKGSIRDVLIDHFAGNAIHGNTNADVANINNCDFYNVIGQRCRNGLYLEGGDTNASTVINCTFSSNRRYGIWLKDALGNTIIGGDVSSNGVWSSTPEFNGRCLYNGNVYYCLPNQEAWASANPPSGTTEPNTGWAYYGTAANDPSAPAWAGGMSVRATGPIRIEGGGQYSTIVGTYRELDQNPATIQGPVVIVGGVMSAVDFGGAPWPSMISGESGFTVKGATTIQGPLLFKPFSGVYFPSVVGQMAVELDGDAQLTFRVKGSDDVIRSVSLALT